MKSDKLDIKIQEAATHIDPAYNELAWSSMEKLLDKEMPQQKKDKRRIFWLFLFLFLGTGVLLLINHPWQNAGDIVASAKIDAAIRANTRKSTSTELTNNLDNTNKNTLPPSRPPVNEITFQKSFSQKTFKNTQAQKAINNATTETNEVNELVAYHRNDRMESEKRMNQPITNSANNNKAEQRSNSQNNIETIKKDGVEVNTHENKNENEKNNSLIKENNKNTTSGTKVTAQKNRNQFTHSFALSFSAGPDVSAVSIHNIGKINLAYGAGVSYQFSKKFTLRTGFYFTKKSYEAKASDYHPPTNFWNYYPDLNYIDADCKIYEVPLIFNYNFSQTPNHLWFGSAGFSSYFMKREDYDYFSKNAAGQNSYDSYSIKNKNQHYFSSIRLSAGYEKKLGNGISIITEPYLCMPINGIGYGKVKLYGAGVLFTLNIKPFAKK